jgi:hypothetical protein
LWSVDPGIDEFVQRADHEESCHIGSGPLGDDGAPESPVRDHLGAGNHRPHECWSEMLPDLAVVGNTASALADGPDYRAGKKCSEWLALEGVQGEEGGMSPQCVSMGLVPDSESDFGRVGIDSPKNLDLAVEDRLENSEAGTRETSYVAADLGDVLKKSEPAEAVSMS